MFDKRVHLTGKWYFRLDPGNIGQADNWHETVISEEWNTIGIPGCWDIFGWDAPAGVGWYRHAFDLAPSKVEMLNLCLAGIDTTATVRLNSDRLESCSPNPYRFVANIAGRLKPTGNTITIRVPDRGVPGGILQDAWIGPDVEPADALVTRHSDHPARPAADWVRDAVIYEVYPRAFSREGTFAGLEERLDELKDLGVTVLWLMPIHPIGRLHRKGSLGCPYSIRDYYAVNPEHGTLDDFRSLLEAAHQRGLKLTIDLVINHCAWDNPLAEEHPDWFARDRRGKLVSPCDWTDVVRFDYRSAELRRYMTEMMLYWLRDVGIDGFRCDVAGMVPIDFWEAVRAPLDAVKPTMLLAEDDLPVQHRHAFDLTYDWRTYQVLGRLSTGTLAAESIAAILANEQLDFPNDSWRLRFSTNHDLCAWHKPAIARYGPSAARAAAVITFALPGVPLIYNGQEAANHVKLSLFERTPIDWRADDRGLRQLFSDLSRVRRELISLRRGSIKLILLKTPGILAITRQWQNETSHVLINCTLEKQTIGLERFGMGLSTVLTNSTTGTATPTTNIDLPPLGYWIGTE